MMETIVGKSQHLKLSTEWTKLDVLSEPTVVLSFSGFVPVIQVSAGKDPTPRMLFIGAKTLSYPLAKLLLGETKDQFKGVTFWARKSGEGRDAPFEVSSVDPAAAGSGGGTA